MTTLAETGEELRRMVEEAAESRCSNLKLREAKVAKREKDIEAWARLQRILEIRYEDEIPSGDIVIRVRRCDFVAMRDPKDADELAKHCEITVEKEKT